MPIIGNDRRRSVPVMGPEAWDSRANCKQCVSNREKREKPQRSRKKPKTQTFRRDIIESTRKRYHRVAIGRPVLIPGEGADEESRCDPDRQCPEIATGLSDPCNDKLRSALSKIATSDFVLLAMTFVVCRCLLDLSLRGFEEAAAISGKCCCGTQVPVGNPSVSLVADTSPCTGEALVQCAFWLAAMIQQLPKIATGLSDPCNDRLRSALPKIATSDFVLLAMTFVVRGCLLDLSLRGFEEAAAISGKCCCGMQVPARDPSGASRQLPLRRGAFGEPRQSQGSAAVGRRCLHATPQALRASSPYAGEPLGSRGNLRAVRIRTAGACSGRLITAPTNTTGSADKECSCLHTTPPSALWLTPPLAQGRLFIWKTLAGGRRFLIPGFCTAMGAEDINYHQKGRCIHGKQKSCKQVRKTGG